MNFINNDSFMNLQKFSSFLSVLIDYTHNIQVNKERHQEWKGYVYASSFFVISMMASIMFNMNFHIGMTLGMRIKSALIAAVYKKVMCIETFLLLTYQTTHKLL